MGVRDRLLLAVLVTVAVALVAATLVFNYLLSVRLSSDIDDRLRTMVNSYNQGITATETGITYPRASGDFRQLGSQVFVVVDGAIVSGPDASPAVEEAVRGLHNQPSQYVNVPDEEVRLWGVPLTTDKGERIATLVGGLYTGSYSRTKNIALIGSAALMSVLLIFVGFLARWMLNAAFRPVAKMTADAEAWSAADLDRRFEMGEPHDEVTRLAHTLDGMLDRIAASLRREQRFSAEVSHQLRTPVAKIKAEAELALRRERDPEYYQEALTSVSHSADQMAATVETLLAAAQEEGSLARGRADARRVMDEVADSVEMLAAQNSVKVTVQPLARDLRVGVARDIATQIIQPVVENACRFARSKVVLAASRNGKEVRFTVEDDGPGVTDDEKDKIFEPGVRGSAAGTQQHASRGAGLGLSLARRLARAASGDVEVASGQAGARFTVRLPAG
ncbi:MAG: HAMP domain-containing histidine kinase [Armatimonadetes bacterium]|nr:HAMP domain-containing histidine kinase [Armatimonadota bacterium]